MRGNFSVFVKLFGPSSMWANRSRLKMKIPSYVLHVLGREQGWEYTGLSVDTGIEDEGSVRQMFGQ